MSTSKFEYQDLYNSNNALVGITSAFTWGIVLSPLSNGLAYLIGSIVIWEIIIYFASSKWSPVMRLIYIIFGFLGFYIGRLIIGDDEPLRFSYGNDPNKKFIKK